MMKRLSLSMVFVLALVAAAPAQQTPDLPASVSLFQKVRTVANVVYEHANGWEGKLDVYAQRTPPNSPPTPVVIFIHGGGWVQGTKEGSMIRGVLPYVAMGYSVVNVEYRLANVSLAPAAIEDCRCALRWVIAHAKDYNLDVNRIVVAGESAGGHLALTTGMIPASAGFDRMCFTTTEPRVAAIVDFFGITDIADLLDGPNKKPFPESWPYTVQWLGNQPNRAEIAKAAAPLTYVRAGVPPTIAIHGDADPLVPYAHSTRLLDGLQKAGVAHELVTIPGGGHGNFSTTEWQRAFTAVEKFLSTQLATAKPPSTAPPQ
ncbi:MAG TPA: alpha/beta hydrolase [Vicinamibacterales bacterium]|nr:alpha/beta hydrolase [Vicinamibacterales bacterium]